MAVTEVSAVEYAQDLQRLLIDAEAEQKFALAAEALRLLGTETADWDSLHPRYYVDSTYAIDQPLQEKAVNKRLIIFGKTATEGTFESFSYVHLGPLVSNRAPVRSLCLSLKDVQLLPDGDLLPEGDVLHVPVLAISQSLRIS